MKPLAITQFDAVSTDIPLPLAQALAEELVLLTNELAQLAFELGKDPKILRNHMESLQKIDLITQTQLGVADILRTEGSMEERLDGVTLEDMATRLRKALDQFSH